MKRDEEWCRTRRVVAGWHGEQRLAAGGECDGLDAVGDGRAQRRGLQDGAGVQAGLASGLTTHVLWLST